MHVRFIFSENFEYTSKPRVNSFHAAKGIQNTSIQSSEQEEQKEQQEESLSDKEHGQQQQEEHTEKCFAFKKMLNVT